MAIDVRDSLSNRPEHILEAAQAIGRSEQKRKVFEAVYYHKSRTKSVAEVAEATGLSPKQVLEAGLRLSRAGVMEQTSKGGTTAYSQIAFFQHNKAKILAIVDNPSKAATIATKRVPLASFERQRAPETPRRSRSTKRSSKPQAATVAFLATNPDPAAALRTDIEVRAVVRSLKMSGRADKLRISVLPAATVGDLVGALNELAPTVVHFSGHGGDAGLLFDEESLEGVSGVDIDFSMVNKLLAATDRKPRLVIFNACDTLVGAEIFLANVEVVIAMESAIGDVAAAVFSGQFYAALANGQSLASALAQGKNAIELAGLGEFDVPKALVRDGLSLSTLRIVTAS